MADKKINNYTKVRDLVSKGITSPSVVMSQIPAIKNWRTAQKYINESIVELEASTKNTNKRQEYVIMIESLKSMKNDLVIKMMNKNNINHYLSLLKYILKIDDKLTKLMRFDEIEPQDNKIMLEIVTYDPKKHSLPTNHDSANIQAQPHV